MKKQFPVSLFCSFYIFLIFIIMNKMFNLNLDTPKFPRKDGSSLKRAQVA